MSDDTDFEPEPVQHRKSFLPSLPILNFKERPTHYTTKNNRPRWVLHMQAVFWRTLMQLGMFFHRLAPPRPPKPSFYRTIDTTISGRHGQITLYFYAPPEYETQKRLWVDQPESDDEEDEGGTRDRARMRMSISSIGDNLRKRSRSMRKWGGYPVVINFHGGGFTLGSPHDDARWCGTVVQELNALVISVEYRLAPENPFPTAVEDGADAVLWVHKHADELGINRNKIALSGFSSGGNMAFSVPLRLYDHLTGFARNISQVHLPNGEGASSSTNFDRTPTGVPNPNSTEITGVPDTGSTAKLINRDGPSEPSNHQQALKSTPNHDERSIHLPEVQIRCIVPWYPSLDYTRTRDERRATCSRADQELPALFTDLFDDSYLHPPKDVALDSPYLSPGIAPTDLLRNALPEDIIMHTCEWDMLLDEGQHFYQRLISDEIGKSVSYTMVPNVPHGWDKAPNPWKPTPGVREHYLKACKEMKRVMGHRDTAAYDTDGNRRRSIVR